MEELLLRHDPLERCWGIIGVHEPTENRLLKVSSPPHDDWSAQRKREGDKVADVYGHDYDRMVMNRSCAIVMGIGGKPERLIDIEAAKNDGVLVLKRFSGGGTVVVDHSSLWTTFIGRNKMLPTVKPYPREIMEWSANVIFGPAFESWNREINDNDSGSRRSKGRQTLVFEGKWVDERWCSKGVDESLVLPPSEKETQQNSHSTLPTFQLKDNDYVLGERKIGGNAQSIVSGGFLHHTSFLWDWDQMNMDYLTLPEKRPEYRGNRPHDEFLVRLKDHYGKHSVKNSLFAHVKKATGESFELEEMTLNDALKIANDKFGGLQNWFDGKCRTKIVKL